MQRRAWERIERSSRNWQRWMRIVARLLSPTAPRSLAPRRPRPPAAGAASGRPLSRCPLRAERFLRPRVVRRSAARPAAAPQVRPVPPTCSADARCAAPRPVARGQSSPARPSSSAAPRLLLTDHRPTPPSLPSARRPPPPSACHPPPGPPPLALHQGRRHRSAPALRPSSRRSRAASRSGEANRATKTIPRRTAAVISASLAATSDAPVQEQRSTAISPTSRRNRSPRSSTGACRPQHPTISALHHRPDPSRARYSRSTSAASQGHLPT